jgi:hypothetical protein
MYANGLLAKIKDAINFKSNYHCINVLFVVHTLNINAYGFEIFKIFSNQKDDDDDDNDIQSNPNSFLSLVKSNFL